VDNTFMTVKEVKLGSWEFESQGLELDFTLLAWGSDFIRVEDKWSTQRAAGTKGKVHNPFQLRLNAYRVLLTRGRDGTVTFVPELQCMDQTFEFLRDCGMDPL
jgi:hypothetical protein